MNDVVILASFIQEEAGMPAEDAKVSACFHNRLESDDPQWAEHKLESNRGIRVPWRCVASAMRSVRSMRGSGRTRASTGASCRSGIPSIARR